MKISITLTLAKFRQCPKIRDITEFIIKVTNKVSRFCLPPLAKNHTRMKSDHTEILLAESKYITYSERVVEELHSIGENMPSKMSFQIEEEAEEFGILLSITV